MRGKTTVISLRLRALVVLVLPIMQAGANGSPPGFLLLLRSWLLASITNIFVVRLDIYMQPRCAGWRIG